MTFAIFCFFGGLALISAALMITQRNPMRSVLFLAFSVLATAGVFLTMQAEFLAAIQIIVYAGGIVVLYLFVIIIINLNKIKVEKRSVFARIFIYLFPLLLAIELIYVFIGRSMDIPLKKGDGMNVETLGMLLMTDYIIPFEVSSVLLLGVVIGAIVLARRRLDDGSK